MDRWPTPSDSLTGSLDLWREDGVVLSMKRVKDFPLEACPDIVALQLLMDVVSSETVSMVINTDQTYPK